MRNVLKRAKIKKRWDIVSKWIGKINPDDLSSEPIKDKTGRDGWSEKAIWHYYQICSMIETGDKEKAILHAREASDLFAKQRKFFLRLEAHANFRLGKFIEADEVYKKLSEMTLF
ncbi:hypothetical protein L0222_05205 [bacterium]|nr:hypothetical protein [bacterium]